VIYQVWYPSPKKLLISYLYFFFHIFFSSLFLSLFLSLFVSLFISLFISLSYLFHISFHHVFILLTLLWGRYTWILNVFSSLAWNTGTRSFTTCLQSSFSADCTNSLMASYAAAFKLLSSESGLCIAFGEARKERGKSEERARKERGKSEGRAREERGKSEGRAREERGKGEGRAREERGKGEGRAREERGKSKGRAREGIKKEGKAEMCTLTSQLC
jgi:signal transduction histidine kinase